MSAKFPSRKDRLNKILSGRATSSATGFNILLLFPIRVLISSTVHVIQDNLLGHFNSNGGRWQLSSFIVEVDAKDLLRHSAFS